MFNRGAAAVIESLELCDDNYSVAWELLKDSFSNNRIIIQNRVTALICLIVPKLDKTTHMEWHQSLSGTKMPNMSQFIQFLESWSQTLQATSSNVVSNNSIQSNSMDTLAQRNQRHTYKRQSFTVSQQSKS